jgi:tetratricopeptide (TPR) repeat protein
MKIIMRLAALLALVLVIESCAGSQAFQRGEKYAHNSEWDLAVKEYREANKKQPDDIEYRSALIRAEETAANQHYKKARTFLQERKLDQAITELQQAIYLNPTNAATQRGRVYDQRGGCGAEKTAARWGSGFGSHSCRCYRRGAPFSVEA